MESVIITIGSEEAMFTALLAVIDPGDEVLGPEPGYPVYRDIAGLIGATYAPIPCRDHGYTLDVDPLLGPSLHDPRRRRHLALEPHRPLRR